MNKHLTLVLATALGSALAGCALSPAQLRVQGERAEFSSAQAPRAVAHCITRNADRFKTVIGVNAPLPWAIRDDADYEVLVSNPWHGGYLLVAEVRQREGGSRVVTWLTPEPPTPDTRQQLIGGCE